MAADGTEAETVPGSATFKASDFGLAQDDLDDLNDDDFDEDEEDEEDESDPIAAERRRRHNAKQGNLRRSAGEPEKPHIEEVSKLQPAFVDMLRAVLAY